MIVPMKKYSFLIYHKDYVQFLESLQNLGVIHIIQKKIESDAKLKQMKEQVELFDKTIKFLKKRNVERKEINDNVDGNTILKEILDKKGELDRLSQQLVSINKEIMILEPWGDFSLESIEKLKEVDIKVRFFTCSERKFNEEWKNKYSLEIINKIQNSLYFVVFQKGSEKIDLDAEMLKLPEKSLKEALKEKEEIIKKIDSIEKYFDKCAELYIPVLENEKNKLWDRIDFDLAYNSANKEGDDKLLILQGWIPIPQEEKLLEFLNKTSIVFIGEDPQPNDNIPILLKNNSFARLFEPIGKLFSLPSYAELDLTPFFAPFFMLFFGFCLGDAGYGLVIFLAATILKFVIKNNDYKPFLSLGQVLGLSTLFVGSLSGTLFGFSLVEYNAFKDKILIKNNEQLFNLAIVLGIVQIIFGMFVQVANKIKQEGFVYSLSVIGTIIFVVSLLAQVGLGKNHNYYNIAKISTYVGLFFIFFFSMPGKNIFLQIGKGFWDLYNIVTGVFGDTLSYVRLFALGVSGGILGYVINTIAMQFKAIPVIGPVVFLIFMIVGHLANLLLGMLGAVVHPMRLTFVEFYKNAGFTGGGKEFKPFAKKSK